MMSNKYKSSKEVPISALALRLRELSGVISKPNIRDSELTMRIPAEVDRDADLVLSESANRLEQLQCENDALSQRLLAVSDLTRFMCKTWTDIDAFVYANCNGSALMKYPVIQGTSNQNKLNSIGCQSFDKQNVKLGVEHLLSQQGLNNG